MVLELERQRLGGIVGELDGVLRRGRPRATPPAPPLRERWRVKAAPREGADICTALPGITSATGKIVADDLVFASHAGCTESSSKARRGILTVDRSGRERKFEIAGHSCDGRCRCRGRAARCCSGPALGPWRGRWCDRRPRSPRSAAADRAGRNASSPDEVM